LAPSILKICNIRIAQNNIAQVNIAPKRQHTHPAHVEEVRRRYHYSLLERSGKRQPSQVLSGRDNINMQFLNKNHSILVSCLAVTTNENLPDKYMCIYGVLFKKISFFLSPGLLTNYLIGRACLAAAASRFILIAKSCTRE
jgi:hypothetical protein